MNLDVSKKWILSFLMIYAFHSIGIGSETGQNYLGTVIVPAPSNMGKIAYFEIRGEPGAEQTDEIKYTFCKIDENSLPKKLGCDGLRRQTKLNTLTTTPPGLYIVVYSNTTYFLMLTQNQKKIVELGKIFVPKTERPVLFNVFKDLTNVEMQNLYLLEIYTYTKNFKYVSDLTARLCGDTRTAHAKELCNVIKSNSHLNWRDRIIKFDAEGNWAYLDADSTTLKLEWNGRAWVTDPKSGEFVSVFPGVYGIEFTDPEIGAKQSRYGIRVK